MLCSWRVKSYGNQVREELILVAVGFIIVLSFCSLSTDIR